MKTYNNKSSALGRATLSQNLLTTDVVVVGTATRGQSKEEFKALLKASLIRLGVIRDDAATETRRNPS